MANTFLNLPAPAANAAGAEVDVSSLGATKTIVVEGNGTLYEPYVEIQVSNDAAFQIWTPIYQFRSPGSITLNVCCRYMRAVTQNYVRNAAPTVSVGGEATGQSFDQLVAPANNGTGAAVDVSALPPLKTFQVSGTFKGTCNIQISNDGGTTWALAEGLSFQNKGGLVTLALVADQMRVSRSGIQDFESNPGLPVIDIAADDSSGGSGGATGGPIAFVFRPGGVADNNVYTDWATMVAAMNATAGMKEAQIDTSITSPAVIPAGVWDMSQTEITAFRDGATLATANASVSIADGCSFTNLRRVGQDIILTNLNTTTAPVVIPAGGAIFKLGNGGNGIANITNTGAAPFFDCTALTGTFLIQMTGQISGANPAIAMGASTGTISLAMYNLASVNAGMITGAAAGAFVNVSHYGPGTQFNRQSGFAGTIRHGLPNSTNGLQPWQRFNTYPVSVNQAAPAASAVAFTASTGLGMNSVMRFDTTAGNISQTLPLIRAAAPTAGAQFTTAGVIDSTGMMVVLKNELGANKVIIIPDATTPDTLDGGAITSLELSPGGWVVLVSNGVSNWDVAASSTVRSQGLAVNNALPTPAANTTFQAAQTIAARAMLAHIGPDGFQTPLQPFLGQRCIGTWRPSSGAGAMVVNNMAGATVTGTATARTPASTNLFTSVRRLGVVSAAGAGSTAAVFAGSTLRQFWRGNAAGLGGFHAIFRFGISDAVLVNTANMIVGLMSGMPADVAPSTLLNQIGVGVDSGDTELQFYCAGAGAQARVSLGVNFPANTISVDLYELAIFCAPNTTTLDVQVRRLNVPAQAPFTTQVTASGANAPANTQFLCPGVVRSNGGTAAAVALDLCEVYIETNT